ncbi:MAG: hypothetical protein HY704_17435 [Gemmatimonadetes bacterium]|nr:hypothetical protein [Gemmatimonadota bacterium]
MANANTAELVSFLRAVRARAEAIRRGELERALQRMGHLERRDRDAIEMLTRQLVKRLLRGPALRVQQAWANGGDGAALEDARHLLGLGARAEAAVAASAVVGGLEAGRRLGGGRARQDSGGDGTSCT